MDADFSIELGADDPVLDFPWSDPSGLAYVDLKGNPELVATIEEAKKFPELAEFLRTTNSARSMVATAKSDAWPDTEMLPEEDIYEASHKFASYVDVVFCGPDDCRSLPAHEQFARRLVELLVRAPQIPAAVEICIRRCYFTRDGVEEGLYCTLYINGYGADSASARQNWGIATKLLANAILQVSAEQQ
jgi:hypothetical protein